MIKVIAAVVFTLIVFSGFMYLKQPNMVFFPIKELRAAPGSWGMAYEDVHFNASGKGNASNDDVVLHGWFIPRTGATKTVLFFHGNAGNISHRGESVSVFHNAGLNVFIFDYRGYGMSTGEPSESGVYEDARGAWKYLTETKGIAESDIILFGRSLGGAVATQLATEVSAAGLILESTFSSAKDVARKLMPYMSYMFYIRFDFDTIDKIKNVRMPLLVMHSPNDDIIPFILGKKVFDSANDPKTFFELRGDHNSGFMESQPDYQQTLEKYVTRLAVK